jgi:hypothetical protein
MNMRLSRRSAAAIVAGLFASNLLGLPPSEAAGATNDASVETLSASELKTASEDPATKDERANARQNFLKQSADNGQLYDSSEVNSAVVGKTSVAWSTSVDLSKVVVAKGLEGSSDEGVVGLGAVGSNEPNASDVDLARLGSESLNGIDGQWGDRDGGVLQVSNDGFKLISGWERWRVREDKPDREIYYYGHWATAIGKYVDGWDEAPYVVDVRSRPKDGLLWTFWQMRNYWPKVEEPSCSSTGEIGISVQGFSGSLPLQNCSSLVPTPDPNTITMRVVWDAGSCKDQTTEGADLGMAVDTKEDHNAILSDYAYAQFNPLSRPCDSVESDNVRVIYKDPGW